MYSLLRAILFKLDPETAHHFTFTLAQFAQKSRLSTFLYPLFGVEDKRLNQEIWGLNFENPVGLAAGFDKNAKLLPFWKDLGFGFAEVGSVSAQPSKGNPKPRLFRFPKDQALINRMGLNNEGASQVKQRLEKYASSIKGAGGIHIGINLAKTHSPQIMGEAALADFSTSYQQLAPFAHFVVLNISCPNTTEGKTFESPDTLAALLQTIAKVRIEKPLLIKLSPPKNDDFGAYRELLSVISAFEVNGLVATNTASDRIGLHTNTTQMGNGGLSGKPLQQRSTALIRFLHQETQGKYPIIGVGGIDSAKSAIEKLEAGASLLELYTGLVYEGPGLIKRIHKGIIQEMEKRGFQQISDFHAK